MAEVKNGEGESDIVKIGRLKKKGQGLTGALSWKERYFVLRNTGDFQYYSDSECKNLIKQIDLKQVFKVQRKDPKTLLLHTLRRTWHLYDINNPELDDWESLLRKFSTKKDTLLYNINNVNILNLESSINKKYGFIIDGFTINLTGNVNISSRLTFSSFIYPQRTYNIKINGNNKLNIHNDITEIQLFGNYKYSIDLHKSSLNKDNKYKYNIDLINNKTDTFSSIKHNFNEQEEGKHDEFEHKLNDSDIMIVNDLLCNYVMNGTHNVNISGKINNGLFNTGILVSDNRKINAKIKIDGIAYIKSVCKILKRNENYMEWKEYCFKLMQIEMDKRIRQLNQQKNSLINGQGNQLYKLPNYMTKFMPLKKYYTRKIPQEILNKKILCHIQNIEIEKFGERLTKIMYIMAEIRFVKKRIGGENESTKYYYEIIEYMSDINNSLLLPNKIKSNDCVIL